MNPRLTPLSKQKGAEGTIRRWYRPYVCIGVPLHVGAGAGVDTKVWPIPSSNCAAHFVLTESMNDNRLTAISASINQLQRPTSTKENPMATMITHTNTAQIRVARRSQTYWRVTIDNPPINVMGPEMVRQFQEVIDDLEADQHVRVVVFDSAVDDYFLNHSDFLARLEDLTAMPAGPTGLPPWPDFLVRLTRAPVASIALIRGDWQAG